MYSGLLEVLELKPDGKRLVHVLGEIKRRAEPLLARIVATFPDFTPHDISHSEMVVKDLAWLIPVSLKEKLNAYEIYFLVASAYLHDIGMADFPSLPKHLSQDSISSAEATHHIREEHHLRSEGWIIDNFQALGIEDESQARIIGRICRGHRKENLLDGVLFSNDFMYKNFSINIPLLSAFLRIADELDLTSQRAPAVVYEHLPPRDPISKMEWELHLHVAGVGPDPDDPLTIKCTARCENPKIHRAMKRLEAKINRELDDLPNHLHQYRSTRKDLPRKYLIKIETVGYKPQDFKFTLQEKQIVGLLMGERLYKRKEEALRELLKNSVDTCRYKRNVCRESGKEYQPRIVLELTPEGDRVIVADNGAGMDEEIVDRYFSRIGESFYGSPDFLQTKPDFTPVSELGVGILSCFMIADKLVVDTRADQAPPLRIEIDDLSDYFLISQGDRKDSGTTVTLFLKGNMVGKLDLKSEIERYARHLEFPVVVKIGDSPETRIGDAGFDTYLASKVPETSTFYRIKVNTNDVEGTIALVFRKDADVGFRPALFEYGSDREHAFLYDKPAQHLFVSNEGILVGNIEITPRYLNTNKIFADLNLRHGALELNAARNDVVTNRRFEEFREKLGKVLSSSLDELVALLETKEAALKVTTHKYVNDFCERYLETYYTEDEEDIKIADGIDLVKSHYYLKCVLNGVIHYWHHKELINKGRSVSIVEGLSGWYYHDEFIDQVVSSCTGFAADTIYVLYPSGFFRHVFENFKPKPLTSYLGVRRLHELDGMIPKTWHLVSFRNYRSSRLLEFADYPQTLMNADNRFARLLVRVSGSLDRDTRIVIEGFFRSLRTNARYNFEELRTKQRHVLELLATSGLINKDEMENYLLTEDDFDPHLLRVRRW